MSTDHEAEALAELEAHRSDPDYWRRRAAESRRKAAEAWAELAEHERATARWERKVAEGKAEQARIAVLAESMVSPEQRRRNQEYARHVAARDWQRRRAEMGRCRCNSMWHWHPTPAWLRVIQWGFVAYLVAWVVVAWLAERF
jgi:hypothetical protein